jgi:hypothetical protein
LDLTNSNIGLKTSKCFLSMVGTIVSANTAFFDSLNLLIDPHPGFGSLEK